jgi:hypothetical protein
MLTHRERIMKKLGVPKETQFSLSELAIIFQIPQSALQQVYNRGIGAWKNNLASVRLKKDFSKNPNTDIYPFSARLSKEQWAMARVFSFLDKGTTYGTTDSDIAREIGY